MVERTKRDPLLAGIKKPGSIGLSEALWAELDREAAIDGARSRSEFVADLLVWAIRTLQDERSKVSKPKK